MSAAYKNNFLKSVIFRVDFDEIVLGQLENFFNDSIKSRFPEHKSRTISEGYFQINIERNEMTQKKFDLMAWRFEQKDQDKVIKALEISSKYLFIEYFEYQNSEHLFEDVEAVMKRFIETFQVKTINRIGLRYSNVIGLEEIHDFQSWSEYLEDNLIGPINFAVQTGKPSARTMGQIVLKEDDGDIVMNFGIFNKSYPSAANPKEFILDFDCSSNLPFECNLGVIEKVKKYKDHIEPLFEKCIKDKLREKLNS